MRKAAMPALSLWKIREIFLQSPAAKVSSGGALPFVKEKSGYVFYPFPEYDLYFTSRQIRQIVLDEDYFSVARQRADVDGILDDLGYTANGPDECKFCIYCGGAPG